ncbi:hypothetical protein D9M69_533090 [compost metagenome]
MSVDKTRHDEPVLAINNSCIGSRREILPDSRNPSILNQEVALNWATSMLRAHCQDSRVFDYRLLLFHGHRSVLIVATTGLVVH